VCANKVNGSDAKGTAKWQGDSLVIDSTRQIQDVQITSKEVWTLSEGGKVLTINNHVSIPQQGDFDIKLVLEKQ
jgi:FlaG/FlaF family flagellin (archaellin)